MSYLLHEMALQDERVGLVVAIPLIAEAEVNSEEGEEVSYALVREEPLFVREELVVVKGGGG